MNSRNTLLSVVPLITLAALVVLPTSTAVAYDYYWVGPHAYGSRHNSDWWVGGEPAGYPGATDSASISSYDYPEIREVKRLLPHPPKWIPLSHAISPRPR